MSEPRSDSGNRKVPQAPAAPAEPRSPRAVRSAARILHKEATRILAKHGDRVAKKPAEAMRESILEIERLRDTEDYAALQTEAERLDELLEQHASFARKSALRETLENIGIAVFIALGLRSCLYEPFKIPSGSMMPTLRNGDHIFVNKFVYGVQIPFTTTVVGESLGDIGHGDVIVFRFPLDESQDFIKRVIGLPGDEVRVQGRAVSLKAAGTDEFVPLPRKKLEEPCHDDTGTRPVANCTLYEETHGEHVYTVRYRLTSEERGELAAPAQVWKVPEGHLLVMGDNRNDSLDSRRWRETVEAVQADGLLSTKDLRDLTDERLFSMTRPEQIEAQADSDHDHVVFTASHRALDRDLALEVWRQPGLGTQAMYDTRVAAQRDARAADWATLTAPITAQPQAQAVAQAGQKIAQLHVAQDEHGQHAIVRLSEPEIVAALSCGRALCNDESALAERVAAVIDRLDAKGSREARELLVRPDDPDSTYSSQFKSRHNPRDHYYERRFASAEGEGPRAQVRLRAFRRPDEGTELVRDAALRSLDLDPDAPDAPEPEMTDTGMARWVVDAGDTWVTVAADTAREIVVVLSCGKLVCNRQAAADKLADEVLGRVPRAAGDRRRLAALLTKQDLDGALAEVPVPRPELAEYDRVRLEATTKDQKYSVELQAWLTPQGGAAAKLQSLADAHDGDPGEPTSIDDGRAWATDEALEVVFPVAEGDAVVQLRCYRGLCPTQQVLRGLMQRVASRAQDTSTFIDPEASRPKPFVPRGNVKGRADRIWLPFSRFWLPIK